jgi:predicted nucleotidyltransferase
VLVEEYEKLKNRFYSENPDKEILFLIVAGSHFFNLNSESSDRDYRGIFVSKIGEETSKGEITYKTNDAKNKKNTSEDVDCTFFSLKKFLTLLGTGDFNMVEMLYAPMDKILVTSEIYEELRAIRESIIINDISSFLGFIKKEYKRYGVDKNHYGIQTNFLEFLKGIKKNSHHDTLKDHWSEVLEYARKEDSYVKISSTWNVNKELPSIVIAKRLFQNTVEINYVVDALEYNLTKYGHRRKSMAEAGVEFKGLYHAMRLILEAEELLVTGRLSFPFSKERHELLKSIKESKIDPDFLFESIDEGIERLHVLEKKTISNQKNVLHLIDKLIFKYYGRIEIQKVCPNLRLPRM